jgi:hypothetical protein
MGKGDRFAAAVLSRHRSSHALMDATKRVEAILQLCVTAAKTVRCIPAGSGGVPSGSPAVGEAEVPASHHATYAARAATTLAAYAPGAGGLPIDSAAFFGAAHVR